MMKSERCHLLKASPWLVGVGARWPSRARVIDCERIGQPASNWLIYSTQSSGGSHSSDFFPLSTLLVAHSIGPAEAVRRRPNLLTAFVYNYRRPLGRGNVAATLFPWSSALSRPPVRNQYHCDAKVASCDERFFQPPDCLAPLQQVATGGGAHSSNEIQ